MGVLKKQYYLRYFLIDLILYKCNKLMVKKNIQDKLRKPKYIVPLLNPKPKCGKDCLALQPELPNFGIIRTYGQYLLTYNQNVMYLLDPDGPQVLATLSQFRG